MRLTPKAISLLLLAVTVSAISGFALATSMNNRDTHQGHGSDTASLPTETGQSAFAAIAEIVSILDENPETNWSKVNIAALREHLVDMNALTLDANVEVIETEDSIEFIVTGHGNILRAAQNMVPAHARELSKMKEWNAVGEVTSNGARLMIETPDQETFAKTKALGFFGLMATGAHHQPHHLGMATGQMIH
ncbi:MULTISPECIES: hypothetical protein [unclassified Lentilitoribacter]|uniref:hypothetical protein n=1 Tax=unclassified Lentilitoribacter TaxID=2647570 RepID=UPI0013A68F90|nr:hypothetical protein [Lentilitoribacter sp. Alg239-R112]